MNNKRLSSGSSWGLPRGRPAGVADILEICWASKNALEKAASLTAVENIAKTLWAELSSYSRKSSVLPAAMSGEVALPGGNTHAEALCDLYRRQRGQKLRLQYTANSQVLDEWITIKDVENAEAMRVIFRRLGAFAGACSDKVLSRFESKAIWSNMYVFDVSYRLQQESFQTAIWEMGNFLNLPTDTLIDEMRTAFAVRDSILERHTKAEELWCSVLHSIQDRKDLPTAEKLISSFLLAPSQAAACERAFASITQLKGQLGHDCSPSTLEQYLLVGQGPSVEDALKNGFLAKCTSKFLSSKSRQYRKGRTVIQRKRKQRSDLGKTRTTYKKRRKYQGLRSQATARHLQRGAGEEVEMDVAPQDVEEHEIWIQMSPRKKK